MSAVLNLNQSIYPLSCVQLAQRAYKDIANIEIRNQGQYWRCNFMSCVADEETTMREFENYCIGLIGRKTRT